MKKFFIIFSLLIVALVSISFIFWLFILPNFVNSKQGLKLVQDYVNKNYDMDIEIENPVLKTRFRPTIDFGVDKFTLIKDKEELINLQKFNISVSYNRIFLKQIKLNKISAKTLIIREDKLYEELMKFNKNEPQTQSDFKVDFYSASDISLENLKISYIKNKTIIDVNADNIFFNRKDDYDVLNFNSKVTLSNKNKAYMVINADSKGDLKFYSNKIKIEDFIVKVNNSKIKLISDIDLKNINLNVKSDQFLLEDIFNIINSDLIIPDGSLYLAPLVNPKGSVSFDLNYNNNDLSGVINIKNTKASLKDLSNVPLTVREGKIRIYPDKIDFDNLKGFWGKNTKNTLEISGIIKDYYKTFDSDIKVNTVITNEFLHNYLSPLINLKLYLSKPSKTAVIYKAKNGIMDIIWLAKINKGTNFGIDESKSPLSDYDRAVKGDFHIEKDKIDIKNINYYIASNIQRGIKLKPILVFDGLMDMNGKIDKIGFSFGREMPSEFLNIFAGASTFKKGTIKGDLHVEFKNNIPYIVSNMELKDTFIPSQRLKIKNAKISTTQDIINLDMNARFKRTNYNFEGKIKNGLVAPYIIKNLKLEADDIDVERFLTSMNTTQDNKKEDLTNVENDDDTYMFDTNLIRIEDCDFILHKGHYKELEFGNINAELTLDDKGILKIHSNKFDIAKGTSSLKVNCDLKNLKYNIILGVRNIDSNLMAKVLFNLDKEITGLASGIMNLNTDKNLKLNGDIKFNVKDGTIGKIGLVEYVLKIASLFRNPIVMISPGMIMDIISVPEGKFDKISGELKIKDNVIKNINIKSYSKTLSALIRGRFDFERHDASLRIYTRFTTNKNSIFGFLRNISLNALANKVQMNTRNDLNYYQSELVDLPEIDTPSDKTQIFLTTVEGDVENNNFLSSLKKLK